jgi:hypothetical protein
LTCITISGKITASFGDPQPKAEPVQNSPRIILLLEATRVEESEFGHLSVGDVPTLISARWNVISGASITSTGDCTTCDGFCAATLGFNARGIPG